MSAVAKTTEGAVVTADGSTILEMIGRMAIDPALDIEKLDRLIAMQERLAARDAERYFNQALNDAQSELGPVAADASNLQTKSKYASYPALDRVIRPVYSKHGFSLSFDTGDSPLAEHIRVICYMAHRDGHSRSYHVDMPADGKGAKGGDVMTKTHAAGAAMSYGQRYLLKLIFNIAVGEDRDGNKPQEPTTAFADAARAAIQRLTVPDACDTWWKDNVAAIRGA